VHPEPRHVVRTTWSLVGLARLLMQRGVPPHSCRLQLL